MVITSSDSLPKTANLRACKQWWKICFLQGDQEKYYRQIYGRAAVQRLANCAETCDDKRIIYPTKFHSPVDIGTTFNDALEMSDANRNILDNPFMFNKVNENSSDSGIDANFNIPIESHKVGSKEM